MFTFHLAVGLPTVTLLFKYFEHLTKMNRFIIIFLRPEGLAVVRRAAIKSPV